MLQHIMQLAGDNAIKQFDILDKVSQNVANVNTTGYKTERFEQYLTPDGRLEGAERKDVSKGSLMVTRRPLDIAVDGYGFIPVTQPDGVTAYTRDGSMALNSEGYLVTNRGDMVGSGIKIPINYEKLLIQQDGTVQVTFKEKNTPETLGKITLVRFVQPEGLKSIGYNKLVATEASGEPQDDPDSHVKQGSLERANVNVFHQVDQILRLNASVISNMRVVKFTDEILRNAVNLKQ